MKSIKQILVGLLLLIISGGAYAQAPGSPSSVPDTGKKPPKVSTFSGANGAVVAAPPPASAMQANSITTPPSNPIGQFLLLLPVLVLGFGLSIIIFMIIHFKNGKMESEESIKIISIVLIVTGVLFIISSGTSSSTAVNNSLYAPAFGLLGSIAGYVFGRSVSKAEAQSKPADNQKPTN